MSSEFEPITIKPGKKKDKSKKKSKTKVVVNKLDKYDGDVQVEHGFRMTALELADVLMCAGLNGTERAIVDVVHMFTWQWRRQWAEITRSSFILATGRSEAMVRKSLARLVDMNIIQKKPSPNKKNRYLYHINKKHTTWRVDKVCTKKLERLNDQARKAYNE